MFYAIVASLIAIIFISLIGSLIWYVYMKLRYRTVPSNEALIVTGPNLGDEKKEKNIYRDDQGRYMKVIRGGGHRLRMFQTGTKVSLKSFQLEIKTPKVYTQQGVGIYGEAVATLKVSDTLEGIVKYAEQFLGKNQKDISHEISEVLSSNLRAILSKMTVEQINGDRESFNEQVREIAQDQLDRMGFKITSLGLTDLSDDEGYLENLGRPQIAEVKKTAEIAEVENKRETELKQAEVNEEVSKERYQREMNIADTRKEKDIKDAKILAQTQREKAEADYYAKVKEAEALAKSRIEEGEAEARVIREKSIAEVEAIERRAEAINKHKEVMLTEMIIKMAPEFAKAVSEPLGKVESIRILDGGDGKQVNSLPKVVTKTMAALQESLGQMTGIDLEKIVENISNQNKNDTKNVTEAQKNENLKSVHKTNEEVEGSLNDEKLENADDETDIATENKDSVSESDKSRD